MLFFNGFLTSSLEPFLNSLGVLWFVILVAFIVSLLTVVIYKFTTNQTMMKGLRDDVARLQKDLKKNMQNQAKALSIQKEMMDKQMRMFSHSMTPTLITLLPILIIFGWLNANLSYIPISADTQFTVSVNFDDYIGNAELLVPKGMTIVDNATKEITSKVDWRLMGKPGEYLLEWKVGDKSYTKDVIIGNGQAYADKTENINDGVVKTIEINYKPQKVLNLFGWKLGWLGTYIIFSIIFSMIMRSVLKVY